MTRARTEAQPPSVSPDRILLVDDNLTNLQVLYQALEREGYELLVARSGEEALEIADRAAPAVILLDINMPGIDGYETCRCLKSNDATSRSVVVFLSARGEVEDKLRGFDIGAADYISKPFQFEEVVARVRAHLETHRRQRLLEREKSELGARLGESFRELSDGDVAELIAGGESERVEFKSTLRWNLHSNKTDKKIENAVLKTLAAYLNSEGGVLMVGIDDEGRTLGLAADRFPNEDKLLLHLASLAKDVLGGEFTRYVRTSIHDVSEERVLVAQCLRAPRPVFFRRDREEFFYVRTGPASQQLSPSEVLAYLDNQRAQRT